MNRITQTCISCYGFYYNYCCWKSLVLIAKGDLSCNTKKVCEKTLCNKYWITYGFFLMLQSCHRKQKGNYGVKNPTEQLFQSHLSHWVYLLIYIFKTSKAVGVMIFNLNFNFNIFLNTAEHTIFRNCVLNIGNWVYQPLSWCPVVHHQWYFIIMLFPPPSLLLWSVLSSPL